MNGALNSNLISWERSGFKSPDFECQLPKQTHNEDAQQTGVCQTADNSQTAHRAAETVYRQKKTPVTLESHDFMILLPIKTHRLRKTYLWRLPVSCCRRYPFYEIERELMWGCSMVSNGDRRLTVYFFTVGRQWWGGLWKLVFNRFRRWLTNVSSESRPKSSTNWIWNCNWKLTHDKLPRREPVESGLVAKFDQNKSTHESSRIETLTVRWLLCEELPNLRSVLSSQFTRSASKEF